MTNTPPFYVGQRVMAIESHPQGVFSKGEEFLITAIKKCRCGSFIVSIGIPSTTGEYNCTACKHNYKPVREWLFYASRFAPILPAFEQIAYTEIIEEIPVGVN